MKMRTAGSAGKLTVYLEGELDHHEVRSLVARLDRLIEANFPRDLVLDLGGVSFMDSSGIALIPRLHKRLGETGGRMTVAEPTGQALKVIDAAGIDRLVPVLAEMREGAE